MKNKSKKLIPQQLFFKVAYTLLNMKNNKWVIFLNDDMSEIIKNFSQILNNQQMPDNIKNILNSMNNNSNTNSSTNPNNFSNSNNNTFKNNTCNKSQNNNFQNTTPQNNHSQNGNPQNNNSQSGKTQNNNFNTNYNKSFTNNSSNLNNTSANKSNCQNSYNNINSFGDFDMNTILKMQKIMSSLNNDKQNDSRTNLLISLKPYLKDSRKNKVDQYIQLMKMGKIFEILNPSGGDNKHV